MHFGQIEGLLSPPCPWFVLESKFNCMERNLGSLYPGQTLTTKLIIVQLYSLSSTMVADKGTSKRACKITDALEISQTYPMQPHLQCIQLYNLV